MKAKKLLLLFFLVLNTVLILSKDFLEVDIQGDQNINITENLSMVNMSGSNEVGNISYEENNEDYIEPAYGEYHFKDTNLYSASQKDKYEDNNSFAKATDLNYYDETEYRRFYDNTVSGTLHKDPWWELFWRDIDEDYYRFDVFSDAVIDIRLVLIPTNCDYDLELYKHRNIVDARIEDIDLLARSNNMNDESEFIKYNATPGTYYIRVYSANKTFNAQSEYMVAYSVEREDTDKSLKELRFNKGSKGAIWLSDYDPFGFQANSSIGEEVVGSFFYNEISIDNSFTNPFTDRVLNKGKTEHAMFYLWDEVWRKEIHNILGQLEREWTSKVEAGEEKVLKKQKIIEIIDYAGKVVGFSFIFLDVNKGITMALDILGFSFFDGFASICESLIPVDLVTSQKEFLNHIRTLKTAFGREINPLNNEYIVVELGYRVASDKHNATSYARYTCNFSPSFQEDGYDGKDDIILGRKKNGFVQGKTYGFHNEEDIKKIYSREFEEKEDVNTGGNTALKLDDYTMNPRAILEGEYHWYNFTAPTDGEYNFYSIGNVDTYVEFFPKIVPGNSIKGRLFSDDNSGFGNNYSKKLNMAEYQKIFFRVKKINQSAVIGYTPMVSYVGGLNFETELISIDHYKYENEYFFTERNKFIYTSSENQILTKRLRTGVISSDGGKYLTLSAKRNNAGTAYLEYHFPHSISKINYQLALWSESESLILNTSIRLEVLSSDGNWEKVRLFDARTMSKDKDSLIDYTTVLPYNTKSFRFIIETNSVNNENNKGRMVVGDITSFYNLSNREEVS